MSKVYVFLADGFEEIEGLTVVDILRRAGVEVMTVSIMGRLLINGSHGIRVEADALFEDCDYADGDMFVLPGGMPGTTHLGEHEGLSALLKDMYSKEKRLAAICAAPTVFAGLGFLEGRRAVCYPTMTDRLTGAIVTAEKVVTDGPVTTGMGMGTAIAFSLELTAILCGKARADELKQSICYGHR